MSGLENVSEMSVLLFEQIQDTNSLAISGAVRCGREFSCGQIMFLARSYRIRSLRLQKRIPDVSVSLDKNQPRPVSSWMMLLYQCEWGRLHAGKLCTFRQVHLASAFIQSPVTIYTYRRVKAFFVKNAFVIAPEGSTCTSDKKSHVKLMETWADGLWRRRFDSMDTPALPLFVCGGPTRELV